MRRLIIAALAATALATPAVARDYWNGSGFPLDHHFHSPYDNMFGRGGYLAPAPGYYGDARIIHVPPGFNMGDRDDVEVVEGSAAQKFREREARARAKAIADEHICAPVVMYTDAGRLVHPAMGCR
jgi:opacity protein-like surface antigen